MSPFKALAFLVGPNQAISFLKFFKGLLEDFKRRLKALQMAF
jgi:hypothetical protein